MDRPEEELRRMAAAAANRGGEITGGNLPLWAINEIDHLRARLAAYERDLIDKDTGSDRSQDTEYLRAGFLQRGAEIERLESECDDHEQARTALEEELAQTKAELREYRRNTIQRDESVPDGAWCWILADVSPLSEPIPAKGALGIWNADVKLSAAPTKEPSKEEQEARDT